MTMTGTSVSEQQRIQIDSEAREWLRNVQRGDLKPEELEEFGRWMAVPAHAEAFAVGEWSSACIKALDHRSAPQWNGWKEEAMHRAVVGTPKVEALANWSDLVFSPTSPSRRRTGARFIKATLALAAALAVVAVGFRWQQAATPDVLHYQADNTTRSVLLPDGTHLTLDAGTSVDYTRLGSMRRLVLPAGRVYLQVTKDPRHSPFVVASGQVETVVLGTRFQVSQTAGRTEVVLEEGKVRMQQPGSSLSTTLAPGQRGWWTVGASSFQTATANPSSVLAWTRGRLLFENVSLAEAIVDVNRYSRHVKIELADPNVGQLKVSGSYVAGDPELVVAAWEATMPVRAKQVGNQIKLMHK
jgi:transmembrane sensor